MTFAVGAAATAVVAGVLAGGTTHVEAQIRKAERATVAAVAAEAALLRRRRAQSLRSPARTASCA